MKKIKLQPFVYIIIINWNGLKDTIECLNSLKKINYKNKKIIVVDNGSRNNEADAIKKKFPKIFLIKLSKNIGFTGGSNEGIKLALKKNAELVLLLNNDTFVSKGFLEPLINKLLSEESIGMVSPKILYQKSNKIWSMGGKISIITGLTIMIGKGKTSSSYKNIIKPDFLTGCALLVKSHIIKNIGLLNNQYFAYYEDVEWSYRAKKNNYEILTVPGSIIWHKKSSSTGVAGSNKISALQSFFWARNGIIFGKRNLTGIKKTIFIINQFTFKFIFCLTRFQGAKAFLQYLKGLYYGINNKRLQF